MQGHVPSLQVWAITQVVADALIWPMVQQCVLNQSQRHWLFFNVLVVTISLVCQFWTIVWHLKVEPMILVEIFKSFDKTCKNKWHILNPFHSIYGCFAKGQSSQHVGIDVEPPLKRLGVHSICQQGKSPIDCKWVWPSSIVSIPCLCIQFFQSKQRRCWNS
jgi:hypothetical protein